MKDIANNHDDLEKKLQGLSDSSFGPILALRHEVDSMGAVVIDKFNTDTIFNTKFLMVKPEMSKQGLATGLLSGTIQQASALGYKNQDCCLPQRLQEGCHGQRDGDGGRGQV